jgi:hypothetical protein
MLDRLLRRRRAAPRVPATPWTRPLGDPALAAEVLEVASRATAAKPTKALLAAIGELPPGTGALAGHMLSAAAAVKADTDVPPEAGDVLRGLTWIAGADGGEEAVRGLADFAVAGWRKIPQYGPLCRKAADAAIRALAELPQGAGELARLRSQLKPATAQAVVAAAIARSAEVLGLPAGEYEERVVPDYGLGADGRRERELGEHVAVLDASGELRFITASGRALRSVPKAVREQHAGELAELKRTAKDIRAMACAQTLRLERLLAADRAWPLATWRERYLEHGMVGPLARRLIWTFDGAALLPEADELPEAGEVRLWHPVAADPDEVGAWRRRLERLEVTQPFKQAHREVYLLTPAERETRIYSNRFAAHVLGQHQLAALARARGWRYALQGMWDGGDPQVTLELPDHGISASFWVEPPDDGPEGESGVHQYVLSDQVRFIGGAGEPLALEDVPPRLFSELMRDVDLFVGVASIGNDPAWVDRGDERYGEYWSAFAFGALGEQAAARRDLLERLLGKLAIRDAAELDGRFLRVRGQRGTYKIHLGSANVLMEPGDRYLCIVRGRDQTGRVHLPFEGDATLALILSKAFLLARDDAITDPEILSQLRR